MRYLVLVALVALLAGSGCGSSTHAALQLGGTSFGGSGLLHYVPNGRFGHTDLLENTTGQRIEVTEAHVLEPQHTLMHETGPPRFYKWAPPPCPSGALCAPYSYSRRTDPTRPLSVRPGQGVVVELGMSFGRCGEIPSANSAPIDRLSVTYKRSDGQTTTDVVSLERTAIRLQMPKPEDCAQPRSDLRVQAPNNLFTSSYATRPGSTGDDCSIADGTLSFESRLYLLYARERIYLRLPHFTGKGDYTNGIVTLVARKQPAYRTDTASVRVTKATSHVVYAHIFAGHYAHHGEKTVPFKIVGTMRCKITG